MCQEASSSIGPKQEEGRREGLAEAETRSADALAARHACIQDRPRCVAKRTLCTLKSVQQKEAEVRRSLGRDGLADGHDARARPSRGGRF
eukprot:5436174-Pleurochrysis_carterae.AAC.2